MAPTTPLRRPQELGFARHRRRPRALLTENIQGITKSSIRKLARRGGVIRIQHAIYTTIRDVIEKKLKEILRRIVAIVDYKNKKTVTTLDVVYALKHMPDLHPVYGFGWPVKQIPDSRPRAHPTQPRTPNPGTAAIIAKLHRKKAEQQEAIHEGQHERDEADTEPNDGHYDIDSVTSSVYNNPLDDDLDGGFDNDSETLSETNDRVERWVGNVPAARPNAKLNFPVGKVGGFARGQGTK